MSGSSFPPPPKMSGLVTPSSNQPRNAFQSSSNVSLRYQTPPPASMNATAARSVPNKSEFKTPSYEMFAPRTAEQRARLARLADLTVGPIATTSEQSSYVSISSAMCPPQAVDRDKFATPLDPSVAQTLTNTIHVTASLTNIIQHTTSLRVALQESITIAQDVSQRHADLLRHSGELSAAAERLQHEEQVLTRRAEEIGRPLKHYDAIDLMGAFVGVFFKEGGRVTVRGVAKLHVDNLEEVVRVLTEIDEAMVFFGESGGGAAVYGRPGSGRRGKDRYFDATASGSVEYYRRACALQDAALEILRVGVADRISQTCIQIQDALNIPKVPIAADKLEASLAYTRFHGISKRSNALITIARRRWDALGNDSVASTPYEEFLTLCRNTYCGARETLLTSSVRSHMDYLRERHGLVGMTRLASVFLIRLCTIETALYLEFFGDSDKRRRPIKGAKTTVNEDEDNEEISVADDHVEKNSAEGDSELGSKRSGSSLTHPNAATLASQVLLEDSTYRDSEFQNMMGTLCSGLLRTIRRGLVSMLDLDILCQIVSVLREERAVANSSPTTLAVARAISAVIQDTQERLIFCANTALHKEVVRFKPTASDLNYPGKLLGEASKTIIVIDKEEATSKSQSGALETDNFVNDGKPVSLFDPTDAVAAQLRVYYSWFPPMRSVLHILSKIFRVVEPRVFEDIALQSVQSCTKSLKDGSAHILEKSGQIHADLFLVKHLLILREQLSPFDVQLRSVERQLDFSEAGKAVSRFLANRNRRLFSMSTENALVTLLREGVSVQESSVDSKRDLEDCLRSACNDFIEHTSSSILGPIDGFLDRCKNAVGSTGSTNTLAQESFVHGVVVKDIFAKAMEDLDGKLEDISKQMILYLENPTTQSILLKPVIRKLSRALEEAKQFMGKVPDAENGWDAELRMDVMKLSESFEAKVKAAAIKKSTTQ